jgi:TfoX/Sxy family transcriptional regulator of competence genes
MAWKKPSAALVSKFETVCPTATNVEKRLMFGFPAAFVNGHMFAGLHEEKLVLRLADAARHELLKLPGANVFEPMPGRPMREYVVTPALVLDDEAALRRWMKRALEYVSSLPAKKAKAARPPNSPTATATATATAKATKKKP